MVAAITANQDQPPHVQVLTLAAALVVLCDGILKNPHEVIRSIRNAEDHFESMNVHPWSAMQNYAAGEFLDGT